MIVLEKESKRSRPHDRLRDVSGKARLRDKSNRDEDYRQWKGGKRTTERRVERGNPKAVESATQGRTDFISCSLGF